MKHYLGHLLGMNIQQKNVLQLLAQGLQAAMEELMRIQQSGGRDVPFPYLFPTSGEAQRVNITFSAKGYKDCEVLKSEILACCELSSAHTALELHRWTYGVQIPPGAQLDHLTRIATRCLQEVLSTREVTE